MYPIFYICFLLAILFHFNSPFMSTVASQLLGASVTPFQCKQQQPVVGGVSVTQGVSASQFSYHFSIKEFTSYAPTVTSHLLDKSEAAITYI